MTAEHQRPDGHRSNHESAVAGESSGDDGGARYVVQRHPASSLQYDFRLELGEFVASWAVPKGPSTDPRERRLAVRTEDHSLETIAFEERGSEDPYGDETIIVWDTGAFTNRTEHLGRAVPLTEALDNGYLAVDLNGGKLSGAFAITRIGDHNEWMLVKKYDDHIEQQYPLTTSPADAVVFERSNEQLGYI